MLEQEPGGVRQLIDQSMFCCEVGVGSKRFWTGREEKILREVYPAEGLKGCLKLLPDRSARAIYNHAKGMGLRTPSYSAPRKGPYETNDVIDAMIRTVWQSKPEGKAIANLARNAGRPRNWLLRRARVLGLAVPRFKEPRWSAAEDEIISESAHLNFSALAKRLRRAGFKRTETAIAVRLKRLGATREDPDRLTARGLAILLGVDGKRVTAWIDKGWLKAERRGTARTDAQGGDQWWIHRKSVRAFVIDNAAAVDLRKVDKFWFIDLLAGRSEG